MVRCRLGLAAMGTAYTVVQALARGKEQVGRRIAYFVLRKGRRDGHDTVVALAGSVPVSNGIDVRSIFGAVEGVDRQGRCTSVLREITRDCVRLGKKFWAQHGRREAGEGRASTGRAGGPFSADGEVDRKERMYERWTRVHESLREIGEKKFLAPDGRRVVVEGRARGRAGRAQAGLEALLRRMEGLTGRSACTRAG